MKKLLLSACALGLVMSSYRVNAQIELNNDEFNDASTLGTDWTRRYVQEGWNVGPENPNHLQELDINDSSFPGQLRMEPTKSAWFQNHTAALLFKEITGDFVVTAHVNVSNDTGTGLPEEFYTFGGIMARAEANYAGDPNANFDDGLQNYVHIALGNAPLGDVNHIDAMPTPPFLETKNTDGNPMPGDNETQYSFTNISDGDNTDGIEATLRIAKIGPHIIYLVREIGAADFTVARREFRDDLDMAGTLQVGMMSYGGPAYADFPSAFAHNSDINLDPMPLPEVDVMAVYDYIRFNTPEPGMLAGEDLSNDMAVTDVELLSFLNFDSEPYHPLNNDEFDDAGTLADWLRIRETENWMSVDPLEEYDINTSSAGEMYMMPFTSAFRGDKIAPLAYKNIEGNFVFTTDIEVQDRLESGNPTSHESLGGITIRLPQDIDYDVQMGDYAPGQQSHFDLFFGNASSGGATIHAMTNIVNNSLGIPGERETNVTNTRVLRVARIDNVIIAITGTPKVGLGVGTDWEVLQVFVWPSDLPEVLQVGLTAVTDRSKAGTFTALEHNENALNPAVNGLSSNMALPFDPDLVAKFDYARFDNVVVPMGIDPATATNQELISFLGDFIGSRKSKVLSVNEQIAQTTVNVYPNPATDKIVVSNENEVIGNVTIFSSLGETAVEINDVNSDTVEIDISSLASGIYYVKTGNNTQTLIIK